MYSLGACPSKAIAWGRVLIRLFPGGDCHVLVFPPVSHVTEVEPELGGMARCRSFGSFKHEFHLEDATDFIKDGLQVSMSISMWCNQLDDRLSLYRSLLMME